MSEYVKRTAISDALHKKKVTAERKARSPVRSLQ